MPTKGRRLRMRLAAAALGALLCMASGELAAALILPWIRSPAGPASARAASAVVRARDEARPRAKLWYRYRIVCLGDSCTYGIGLKASEAYPAQLEALLNRGGRFRRFEVVNLGLAGSSSNDGLRRLREAALDFRPDLVIASYGLNDKWRAELSDREAELSGHSSSARLLGAAERLLRQSSIFELLRLAFRPVLEARSKRFGRLSVDYRVPLPEYRENLASIAREGRAAGAEVLFLAMAENPAIRSLTDQGVEAYERGAMQQAADRLERCAAITYMYYPRPLYHLALAYRALGRSEQAEKAMLAARQFARVFPYCMPLPLPLENVTVRSHVDGIELGPADQFDIYARYRAAMAEVGAAERVPVLDMTGSGLRPGQFLDYCHLKASGYSVVAQSIAEIVEQRLTP